MPEEQSGQGPGPMVRRQQLGAALRRHRLEAGMSIKDVADRLLVTSSKISRIETSQRNATLRDVRDLCDLYGISDADIREQLMELARGSRERAWWQDAPVAPALKTLIGMEGAARTIHEFELLSVPSLLQTREYAEAITTAYFPDDVVIRSSIVDARMRRQKILEGSPPPAMYAIIDEAALHRIVGDRMTMRNQIDHLIRVIDTATVELRVIPFSAGAHRGMDSGFNILTFAPSTSPNAENVPGTVVYIETLGGSSYLDQPTGVQRFLDTWEALTLLALPAGETLELLRTVRGGL